MMYYYRGEYALPEHPSSYGKIYDVSERREHMSNFKKILALVCVFTLLLGMMAGCKDNKNPEESTEPTGGDVVVGEKTNYTINVKSAGGLALSGITVFVYSDATLSDLEGYGQTDSNGQAVVSIPGSNDYRIVLSGAPDGYIVEESYPLNSATVTIELTSQVIADTDLSGVSYKLGSVMHDFTITDTEGNSYTLSELLKEKEMVMLNFWYTTCTYCVQEFPYMDATYQEYTDSLEIIALNPYSNDDAAAVKDFKDYFYETYDADETTTGGLSFPMAKDDTGISSCFSLSGFPTSVVIDRYGVITMIHAGGLLSADYFYYIYDAFTGDDYTQKLYESFEELVPVKKPNVEMASSEEVAAVFNGSEMDVTYAPETDADAAEMSWPFIIGEKEGVACLYASNAEVEDSYATMYANVTLKKGQALALDYFASSEEGADVLYVLVDRNDVYQISGASSKWKTCYPWVATEDGEYEIAFCYFKDSSENVGDDTVYISNFRIVDVADIDTATYIPRFAATNMSEDGFGYEDYITPVFNKNDGYYHVNSADGPLLLANMMMATRFSNDPVYSIAYNGLVVIDGVNYYDEIVDYCSYASNSQIYSLVPVNEELKGLLQKVTEAVGIEQSENEWLQICEYYDAYGTGGVQLGDPTAGLNAHSAYTAKLGSNSVTYDRVIMPRGLLCKFVPDKSGVYRITSHSDSYVDGWVFVEEDLETQNPMYTYWFNERAWTDEKNVSMVLYLEKGKEYYIDVAFYDVYEYGTIEFTIEYEAKEKDHLILASPGYFTYYDETTYDVVAGGIEVALGSDGYYHEKLANGDLGSKLYVDMGSYSAIFNSQSLFDLIQSGAFNFAMTEDDHWIVDYYDYFEELNFNGTDFETCMKEVWGEDFDYYWEYFEVDDVLDGVYHGTGKDMTAVARKYAEKVITSGELEGCVAVNKELGEVLQMLMDKYTFKGVENSWIKLCYYYDYLGPDANK